MLYGNNSAPINFLHSWSIQVPVELSSVTETARNHTGARLIVDRMDGVLWAADGVRLGVVRNGSQSRVGTGWDVGGEQRCSDCYGERMGRGC